MLFYIIYLQSNRKTSSLSNNVISIEAFNVSFDASRPFRRQLFIKIGDTLEKQTLTGLFPEEITRLLPDQKKKYRSMQLFRWIHERCAASFDEMSNLPKSFREELAESYTVGALENLEVLTSEDKSTDKFLWQLADGNRIESVVIRDEGRTTVCISSQVGCKMKCRFCRTGGMGLIRSLSTGEIVDQLIKIRVWLRERGDDISNIVFMGMGEPLDNVHAVIRAVKIINMETSLAIGVRKVTVSTCGIVPAMLELGSEFKRLGLAISLNATTDELRSELMPINRKYPLKTLLDAAREYAENSKRRITFEYILLKGKNDTIDDAKALKKILTGIPAKINLIVFNEFDEAPFKSPSKKTVEAFHKWLIDHHMSTFLRKSKGSEILAACGLLAVKGKR